jgi:hypothetical protein
MQQGSGALQLQALCCQLCAQGCLSVPEGALPLLEEVDEALPLCQARMQRCTLWRPDMSLQR